MKKFTAIIVSIIALAFTFSEGFLEALKIGKEDAERSIWDSFSFGNYAGPTSSDYHTISKSTQVAMIKEIGAFAKAYSQTDDFKKLYLEQRENKKPPSLEPYQSTTDLRKKQHDAIAKSLQELEAKLNTFTGDLRKSMDQAVVMLKQQLKDTDDPKNPMFSAEMEAMMKKGYNERVTEHQKQLTEWQMEYPESPHNLIKKRLTEFMQLSATVDFNAKLQKGDDSKMIFVNPEYEAKDSDWKFIFRSGKEATDAARAVATQWLGEIK